MDTNKVNEGTQLVTEVQNTPFRVIEEEKGAVITIGNQRADRNVYKNTEEAIKEIEKLNWDLICSTIYVYMENVNKTNEESEVKNG